MTDKYKPGTVAVATVQGVPNVQVYRYNAESWISSDLVKGMRVHHDRYVTEVRPLVVLDPDKASGVVDAPKYVADLLRDTGTPTLIDLAAQIETQTRPSKPEVHGTLIEFGLDGRQYFVHPANRLRFLAAESDLERTKIADLVLDGYGVVAKNRRGVVK